MSNLFNAMNATAYTENGAAAFHSTLDSCVDYFFAAGASRGKNIDQKFIRAYNQEPEIALRTLQWMRDIRGGAGEREQFKNNVKALLKLGKTDEVIAVMRKIQVLGRFDDLMAFWNTELQDEAVSLWVSALQNGNGLAFKWAPRKDKKGAKPLRTAMRMNEKTWRKFVVSGTNVVEQKMCAKDWESIEYGKLPSVASARYQKAFARNDNARYAEYLNALEKGEEKINAGAVYPYDVVRSVRRGVAKAADAQWKALPNYLEGTNERFLPVIDVSGSMSVKVSGEISAMDVAVSLGMYLAERNESIFKDQFVTFSSKPRMQKITGASLSARIAGIESADWGMSTNLEGVFTTVLNAAKQHKVSDDEMPTKIIIISDMQFNCVSGGSTQTLYQRMQKLYSESGYTLPQVVFWNVNSRAGDIPVTIGTGGTALVSGFSPSIMKSLLGGELEPRKIMLKAVMDDRYAL